VRSLVGTAVRPNHLTALRVVTGLAAVACFATNASLQGGAWFLVSAFLDRADGELARLSGATTRSGHYLDLAGDLLVTSLLFVGIGAGLRSHAAVGEWAVGLGVLAGGSIALIFLLVSLMENDGLTAMRGGGPLDPDDVLFLVAPVAWAGWLPELLLAAAAGAPAFLFFVFVRWWLTRRRGAGHARFRNPAD
jgi:phosphatidylglycerophosphate synthase